MRYVSKKVVVRNSGRVRCASGSCRAESNYLQLPNLPLVALFLFVCTSTIDLSLGDLRVCAAAAVALPLVFEPLFALVPLSSRGVVL